MPSPNRSAARLADDPPFDRSPMHSIVDRDAHASPLTKLIPLAAGVVLAAGFFAIVGLFQIPAVKQIPVLGELHAPLTRYFLGHPVAVAASILFWFAIAILGWRVIEIAQQRRLLGRIHDENLFAPGPQDSPAGRWLADNDAGHVAAVWLNHLADQPIAVRRSHLVRRLREILLRQSDRGSATGLGDDLRELSTRDGDTAHDALGLVRIIVWAIPMLGFLGTVIGITQTLGGLDFSNGGAAVDSLKSGLYVAFDTTALGLVLSVFAIFLQFPVERAGQDVLDEIDRRVTRLVSSQLPGDEASDNQVAMLAELCRGVQAAVSESLDRQAKLWHSTIDEARDQWQSVHDRQQDRLAEAFEVSLIPALSTHAGALAESTDRIADPWQRWTQAIGSLETTLRRHDETITRRSESVEQANRQSDAIGELSRALEKNLDTLQQTNAAIDRSVAAAAGDGLSSAMRTLARAVDVLARRLDDPATIPDDPMITPRRAA